MTLSHHDSLHNGWKTQFFWVGYANGGSYWSFPNKPNFQPVFPTKHLVISLELEEEIRVLQVNHRSTVKLTTLANIEYFPSRALPLGGKDPGVSVAHFCSG